MPIATMPGHSATPLFLHTGWRSRGTWIWEALRTDPRAMALYEPLNEDLASLTPARIASRQSDSWQSGHGAMAPYWSEFASMLRPGVAGVPGFRTEFTADNAFAGAAAAQPALAAYLRGLLRHAAAQGRVPVLKFCRSMGRVAWMQATFPEALHAVVLRRPDVQWASARQQMERLGNPYFVVMPLLVLARNAQAPAVVQACRSLGVPLPRLRRRGLDHAVDLGVQLAERLSWAVGVPLPQRLHGSLDRAFWLCMQVVEQLSWADRYRAFLAHWMAGALSALATDSLLIDPDMLLWSAQHRCAVAAVVARRTGLHLDLQVDPARAVKAPPPLDRETAAAQRAALTLLDDQRTALQPNGYMLAANLLEAGLRDPGGPEPGLIAPGLVGPARASRKVA